MIEHQDETEVREAFALGFAKRPAEELYDLQNDPHEMRDLAGDPAYAETKATVAAQLMAELERTKDPRVIGDGETFDRPPFAGPIK